MAKAKFGYMNCPDCAEEEPPKKTRVVVKINEHETLTYRCDECDGNGYSKKGEGRYSTWLRKIERAPGASAPAAPAPKAAPKVADKKAEPNAAPAKGGLPWMR